MLVNFFLTFPDPFLRCFWQLDSRQTGSQITICACQAVSQCQCVNLDLQVFIQASYARRSQFPFCQNLLDAENNLISQDNQPISIAHWRNSQSIPIFSIPKAKNTTSSKTVTHCNCARLSERNKFPRVSPPLPRLFFYLAAVNAVGNGVSPLYLEH